MALDHCAPYPRLLGDIGGTHARFGWIQSADVGIAHIGTYACNEYEGLGAAIAGYLEEHRRPAPVSCALGIATPVVSDSVTMTNRAWSFSISDIRRRFGLERLVVLNDFAALALSIPTLAPQELRPVGGGQAIAGATVAILGAGTGLGVSGLLAVHGSLVPITGEGGHASLGASEAIEDRLLSILRGWFGHVSAERVLSGPGIVNLYRASCELAGLPAEPLEPPEVTARAVQGIDACCSDAIALFFGFLGSFAGNLALTLGARGGVYIGGGIVPQLGDRIRTSGFRERFESKGRYRDYLAHIPTWVIADPAAVALRGANRGLDDPGSGLRVAAPA